MSMAFCREAATWSPEEAPRALPRCAARAPAATRIRDNPRAGDARNHRFARHRLLGEARGGRRTTGVGRPGFGAPLALGVCGTDREILEGRYGFAPPGQQRLILG